MPGMRPLLETASTGDEYRTKNNSASSRISTAVDEDGSGCHFMVKGQKVEPLTKSITLKATILRSTQLYKVYTAEGDDGHSSPNTNCGTDSDARL